MREALRLFAIQQERVLLAHDDEKGYDGWLRYPCNAHFLIEKLFEEVNELQEAYRDCQPCIVQEEAIDVANIAMMIFDRIAHSVQGQTDRDRVLGDIQAKTGQGHGPGAASQRGRPT